MADASTAVASPCAREITVWPPIGSGPAAETLANMVPIRQQRCPPPLLGDSAANLPRVKVLEGALGMMVVTLLDHYGVRMGDYAPIRGIRPRRLIIR